VRGFSAAHLLAVYRGLIQAVIDYPAVAFQHLSGSARHKLEVWENQGLRTCLAVMYGTANWAIRAEAGEPVLEQRWAGIVTRYELMCCCREDDLFPEGGPPRRQHAKRFAATVRRAQENRQAGVRYYPVQRGRRAKETVPPWRESTVLQAGPVA